MPAHGALAGELGGIVVKLFASTYALVFGTMALVLMTFVVIAAVVMAVVPSEVLRKVVGG